MAKATKKAAESVETPAAFFVAFAISFPFIKDC